MTPVTLCIKAREEDRKVCKTMGKKLRNIPTSVCKSVTGKKLGSATFSKVDSEVAGLQLSDAFNNKGNLYGLVAELTSRRYLACKGETNLFEIVTSNHQPKVLFDFYFFSLRSNVECQIKKSTRKARLCYCRSYSSNKSESVGGRTLFNARDLQHKDYRLIDDCDVNLISNSAKGVVITHNRTMISSSQIQDGRDVSSCAYYCKYDTLFSGAFKELQTYVSG